MTISAQLVRKMDKLDPDLKDVLLTFLEDIQNTATKTDFNELKDIVRDLAVKVGELSIAQKELTESQNRTEKRVEELAESQNRTEKRVEELAEAQKELTESQNRTEKRVEELAEAQKELTESQNRTEKKVEELAEAQNRTEKIFKELAEAQKELTESQNRTEKSIQELTKEQKEMKDNMAGLGFYLENESYKYLPSLLKRDFGIEIKEGLKRKHIKDKEGNYVEVNIIGKGFKGEEEIIIIGESKHRLSENKINTFNKKVLKRLEGVFNKKLFPVMITHMTSSHEVEGYAIDNGIKVYYSYEFK
jgi:uncharacterized phage infection (PIP) family protein YhgE